MHVWSASTQDHVLSAVKQITKSQTHARAGRESYALLSGVRVEEWSYRRESASVLFRARHLDLLKLVVAWGVSRLFNQASNAVEVQRLKALVIRRVSGQALDWL